MYKRRARSRPRSGGGNEGGDKNATHKLLNISLGDAFLPSSNDASAEPNSKWAVFALHLTTITGSLEHVMFLHGN